MIRGLVKIANKLDSSGLVKEADILDSIIRKVANDPDFDDIDSDFFSEEENEEYFKNNDLRFSEEGDENFFDDYDYENFPEGIGTTEPIFTGGSPEENMITRISAVSKLNEMTDDEFEELRQKYPDVLDEIFGRYSLTPSYKVKNFGSKNGYEE